MEKTLNDLKSAGLSFFPVKSDGSKQPLCDWGQYRESSPTQGEIKLWSEKHKAFAIVCGPMSGNVEVFDFDDKYKKGVFDLWFEKLPEQFQETVKKLPKVESPSGGAHLYYRCSDIEGNRNDFCRGETEIAGGKEMRAFIETRGDGGYVLCPPSSGYELVWGSLLEIPEITPEEREMFFLAAQQLSETAPVEQYSPPHSFSEEKGRPGDEFNNSASWDDILQPHGWSVVYEKSNVRYWRRPGKKKGISATENWNNNGLFHVFSSSTPFENKSYNKFQAYAILEHNADFNAAAKELAKEGYGENTKEESISETEPPDFIITSAASIDPKPIEWLWNQKIAKGKITLIAGNPGLGKSQASLSIAAMESSGSPFPASFQKGGGGDVILLSAEDDMSDTVVPRLTAAGADLTKVHLLSMTKEKDREGNEYKRSFDLGKDTERLGKLMKTMQRVSMVVIDPISAFMGDADSHNNAEVRARLSELSSIAEQNRVAIIGVTHLNKKDTTSAVSRFMGSLAFIAAARAAFLVTKDEESEEDRVLFTPAKNNLAKDIKGLAFQVMSSEISSGGGSIETSKVVWEQREIEMSSEDALGGEKKSGSGRPSAERQEAKEWLIQVLREYPEGLPGTEVKKMARGVGISKNTLYRVVEDKDEWFTVEPAGYGKPHVWKYNNFNP